MHVSRMSAECPARYKYVHFTALPALFFDLEEEPAEFCNLADDPTYQGLALECAQKMLSWRMSHEDRALTTHPHGADRRRPLQTRRAAAIAGPASAAATPIGRLRPRIWAYAVHSRISFGAHDGESPARRPGLIPRIGRSKSDKNWSGRWARPPSNAR